MSPWGGLARRLAAALDQGLAAAAEALRRQAAQAAPELDAGLTVEAGPGWVRVAAMGAAAREFGTLARPAAPVLGPAAEALRADLAAALGRRLDEEIGHGG